jgi:hypothetical protein
MEGAWFGETEGGKRWVSGRRTGRISTRLRSHSSPSSNRTCQMSSASVDTSWSVTTPRYHRWPNFMAADESSDEMVRLRGGWGAEGRRLGGGGVTFDPSRPMGQRGWRWWEMGGRVSTVSPPVGIFVGGIYERTSQRSPLVPLPTYIGGWDESGRGGRWVRGVRLLRVRGRLRGGHFA